MTRESSGGRGTFHEKLVRGRKFHGFIDYTNFRFELYRTEEFWKKEFTRLKVLLENAGLEFVHYNHKLAVVFQSRIFVLEILLYLQIVRSSNVPTSWNDKE